MKAFAKVCGFSLIELLVTLAVMSIGMVVMAGYMSYVTNQQRILMQNAEAISVDNNLTNLMVTGSQHCSGNIKLAKISFKSGSPPKTPINLACQPPPLGPGGCPLQDLFYFDSKGKVLAPDIITGPQTDGSGLNISTIQLENVLGPPGGPYSADVVISYGGTSPPGAFKVRGVSFGASTSGGSDLLDSCLQAQSTCATGFTLVSGTGTSPGESLCISTKAQGPATFGAGIAACASGGTMSHLCSPAEWEEACNWDPGPGSTFAIGTQTNSSTCFCTTKTKPCGGAGGGGGKFGGGFGGGTCTVTTCVDSSGATCTPTYSKVVTSANDGGPILHLGEEVSGSGDGNSGTSEFVDELVEVYDGSNWKAGPVLIGGNAVDTSQKHACDSFKDWWNDTNVNGGSFGYRCCYRP